MVKLTLTEQKVILWISQGLTHQAIAENLDVSVVTIRRYCQRIRDKYSAHSTANAVGAAFLSGDMDDLKQTLELATTFKV